MGRGGEKMEKIGPISRSALSLPAMFSLLLLGCAHKILVEIPSKIDLQSYQTIGIIEFSSSSKDAADKLNQLATQNFMNVIQRAQPQVRFLELGSQGQLLKSVGRERIDPEAIKALGKRHGVQTIFTGTYEISELKPRIRLGEDLASVNASANVRLSLTARHWDATSGATLWTNSRYGEWQLANVSKDSGRPIAFSISTAEERYGNFIAKLVYAVTEDFRPRYEERKVEK